MSTSLATALPVVLDTFARLQLAAALIEYDGDGPLAESSAMFAPYREDVPELEPYQADHSPDAGYDLNEDEHAGMAWRTNDRTSKRLSMAAGGVSPAVFTDFLRDSPNNAIQEEGLHEMEHNVDDADLASEWGLESVMTKFDNLDANELKLNKGGKKPKKRKNSRAQTDILDIMSDVEALDIQGAEVDRSEGFATQSLPDVLDHTARRPKRKGPKQSAGAKERRVSLESELDMAFSDPLGGMPEGEAMAGGRSRSSSLGGMAPSTMSFNALSGPLDAAEMAQLSADYAAEAPARPASSMSTYISRFDPKAIAAQREEELSTRLRFPNSLRPKILIMPAPLAELELGEHEAEAENQPESPKPRIEREAGKLYGRSLMDELNDRKLRQRAKNRAFQGDSRRAMTDNLAARHVRAPSPLGGSPSAEQTAELFDKQIPADTTSDDPWVKYTSHRSLANLAGSPEADAAHLKRVSTLLSPGNSTSPTTPRGHPVSPSAQLSTAELQAAYKRASAIPLQAPPPGLDSDDNVPLQTRQVQLTSTVGVSISPIKAKPETSKPMPSIFGQDLVMQAELQKLEKILAIEEAEKKMKAEKERILELEKEAKEKKKREKAEKKARKKAERDFKAGRVSQEDQPAHPDTETHRHQNRATMLDNGRSEHSICSRYSRLITAQTRS